MLNPLNIIKLKFELKMAKGRSKTEERKDKNQNDEEEAKVPPKSNSKKGGDSFKPPRPDKIKLGDDPLGHKNSKNLSKRLAKENKAFLKMAEMFDTIVKEHTKQSKNEQKLTKNIDDIIYQLSNVNTDESNDKGIIDEATEMFKSTK